MVVVFGISGIILFVLWLINRKEGKDLAQEIRNRLPPEGTRIEKNFSVDAVIKEQEENEEEKIKERNKS